VETEAALGRIRPGLAFDKGMGKVLKVLPSEIISFENPKGFHDSFQVGGGLR